MAIVRWRPISNMLSQWPDLWDNESWQQGLMSTGQRELDVYETEDSVVVRANVAGVQEDDIDLTFEKGVLWIKAERTEEESGDKKHYSKSSWSYSYKVAVPGTIDYKTEPKAEVEDGVVTVTFKKAESSKPKKLKVTRAAKKNS